MCVPKADRAAGGGMSLSGVAFEELSERDLLDLVTAGVPDGVLLDYKRTVYGRSDNDVKEFLKDLTSFANTGGGHLVLGMDEAEGVASGIVPLTGIDIDVELQRLENLARDCIEPRVVGIRMKAVLVQGGAAFVIR